MRAWALIELNASPHSSARRSARSSSATSKILLRNATVRVSVVGDDDAREAAIDGLDHAKGFIRRELGSRLSNLRFAPDLRFELDLGVAYSVRVSQLLREVEQGEPHAGT
jgi:ribosome-binding factor A